MKEKSKELANTVNYEFRWKYTFGHKLGEDLRLLSEANAKNADAAGVTNAGHNANFFHEFFVFVRVRCVRQHLDGHRDLHFLPVMLRDPEAFVHRPECSAPDYATTAELVFADQRELCQVGLCIRWVQWLHRKEHKN